MITGIVVLRFYRLIPFASLGANGFGDCLCRSLGIFSVVDSNFKHTHCVPLHILCIVGFFFFLRLKLHRQNYEHADTVRRLCLKAV